MNISTVNELIQSLESAGELSIREQKFLKLAKAFKQLAAENVALKAAVAEEIEVINRAEGCIQQTRCMVVLPFDSADISRARSRW